VRAPGAGAGRTAAAAARRRGAAWAGVAVGAGLLALVAAGCSEHPVGVAVANQRPMVELSASPEPGDSVFYVVHFQWFAFDADGEIRYFTYAVDPPAAGDTAWVRTADRGLTLSFTAGEPLPPSPSGTIRSAGYHVFVLKAVDNEGLESPTAECAFTSTTIAPTTQVVFPQPSRLLTAVTPPGVRIRWVGSDPDGVAHDTPLRYKYRIDPVEEIRRELGLPDRATPGPTELQAYYLREAPGFASWDSVPAESTFADYAALTPGKVWFFAVTGFDEAGAYDPLFTRDRNILVFQPSTQVVPPRITVFNDLFTYTQGNGSLDVSDARLVRASVPSGEPYRIDWIAQPAQGAEIVGYRWVLDPPDGDLSDETPRERDDQTYRWSGWSVAERAVVLGPFTATPERDDLHRFYVEARDNSGALSIVPVELRVVARSRPLLVIDDFRGLPDRDFGPGDPTSFQPYGSFPTEAVLDTLLFAVGDRPYRHRPPGTLSPPGMFAGFDYDTLDYRFTAQAGIALETLLRYQAVVWYAGSGDAARTRSTPPLGALRYICAPGNTNTLRSYLELGGKVWLFGDGALRSVWFGEQNEDYTYGLPRTPKPGSFLYDYMKIRSQFDTGGVSGGVPDYLATATPYLPEHATPGRVWPPDTTRTYARGVCDDPRVGPAAERIQARWDGLPCLTVTTDPSGWTVPLPTSLNSIMYVSKPVALYEDADPGPATRLEARLDTLYLYHSASYLPSPRPTFGDGKPMMFSYWGDAHGPIVWTNLPLWMFEREQLRVLAEKVLANFGLYRNPSPAAWEGPGSAGAAPAGAAPRAPLARAAATGKASR
jgi:hypothetical protein